MSRPRQPVPRPRGPEPRGDIARLLAQAEQLQARGRLAEAEQACRKVLATLPGNAQALGRLAQVLRRQDKLPEALEACARWRAASPSDGRACLQEAAVLEALGRAEEAIAALRDAPASPATLADACLGLSRLLHACRRHAEAAAALEPLLAHEPENARAWVNLGVIRRAQGDDAAAEAAYRRALAAAPDDALAHRNLGNLLHEAGRYAEAERHLRRSLALDPTSLDTLRSLADNLLHQGRAAESRTVYQQAVARAPDHAGLNSDLLFALNYRDDLSPEAVAAAHLAWGRRVARAIPPRTDHADAPDPERLLRVGYVSCDLREHSVSSFLAPLLTHHDHGRVEIFGYAHCPAPDRMTERLKGLADHWIWAHAFDDAALAERIAADGIDILVDLQGLTGRRNFLGLLARKPAPIQVSWLGYPNTTGLERVDYRLTDAIADPPGAERLHAERLVRLPQGFLCYEPSPFAGEVGPLPADAAVAVTFGSFNNVSKLQPEALASWARILRAVPGSRLMLKGRAFADPETAARFLGQLADLGIAAERVELVARTPTVREHLALYGKVDIALDTFPYNGTTTTCEALLMGVPVVAMAGDRHAARVSASILGRIDLGELVAESPEGYAERAVALAHDLGRLRDLRRGLRARLLASRLCDGPGFARDVEAAYRAMWRAWCEGRGGGG